MDYTITIEKGDYDVFFINIIINHMERILTISVAAYNIEKYIENLMESVLIEGILNDIEILIVDDGSTDQTASIAKKYQCQYPDSVRGISKKNGGHGSTINRGIREANGVYFKAFDGDDWVDSKGLVELVHLLKKCTSDMVICNVKHCNEQDTSVQTECYSLISGKEYTLDECCAKEKWIRYHAIFYRTRLLKENNIQLDENMFYVDNEYDLFPLPYVSTVTYYNVFFYCYRIGIGEQSVSIASRKKNIKQSEQVAYKLITFYKENRDKVDNNVRIYIANGVIQHCLWHSNTIFMLPFTKMNIKKYVDFLGQIKKRDMSFYNELKTKAKRVKFVDKGGFLAAVIIMLYCKFKNRFCKKEY